MSSHKTIGAGIPAGAPIPPSDIHALITSLPTWDDNLAWSKHDESLFSKIKIGYPRFIIHYLVTELSQRIVAKFGGVGDQALLLSSRTAAERCMLFLSDESKGSKHFKTIELRSSPQLPGVTVEEVRWAAIYAVFFPIELLKAAKVFLQHTGAGISSRCAEYCLPLFDRFEKFEVSEQPSAISIMRGVYHAETEQQFTNGVSSANPSCFLIQGDSAKHEIRSLIASLLSEASNLVPTSDVFLYPSGMSALWDLAGAFRAYSSSENSQTIVIYGFLYLDTPKLLTRIDSREIISYGNGDEADLDNLEVKLAGGAKILALYCEFPGNPLLGSPNMQRIRTLADKYDFVVVCDDTVGTAVNVNVISYVDVLFTSLTKLFSGGCNVMGGSLVLNPKSRCHDTIHDALSSKFVDTFFPADAIVMELNSRDFVSRALRANVSGESVAKLLKAHKTVEHVYYPKFSSTRALYDHCKRPGAGYGCFVSVLFKQPIYARTFHDTLDVGRATTFGTNFTLVCPYAAIAHYWESDWAASYGVVQHLVRISVGLEDVAVLLAKIGQALEGIELKEPNGSAAAPDSGEKNEV